MRVVFLDFDGVLNSRKFLLSLNGTASTRHINSDEGIDPVAVDRVNRLLRETGAHVVVSSSLRIGRKRTELCDILNAKGFRGLVLGVTPYSADGVRGREIQSWLDAWDRQRLPGFGPVESIVILDDDSDMVHLAPRLVQTTFEDGLLDEHVDRAIAMLKEAA